MVGRLPQLFHDLHLAPGFKRRAEIIFWNRSGETRPEQKNAAPMPPIE
jgi:hypothetical protein